LLLSVGLDVADDAGWTDATVIEGAVDATPGRRLGDVVAPQAPRLNPATTRTRLRLSGRDGCIGISLGCRGAAKMR
jgi:hypothetical protein